MRPRFPLAILVCLVFSVAIYVYYYQKRAALKVEAKKSVCDLYLYDRDNPNIHGSMGAEFHMQSWKQYESVHGPTGATNLDEFCGP